jgi:hypothetical protein
MQGAHTATYVRHTDDFRQLELFHGQQRKLTHLEGFVHHVCEMVVLDG